jgi:hypothetical protein
MGSGAPNHLHRKDLKGSRKTTAAISAIPMARGRHFKCEFSRNCKAHSHSVSFMLPSVQKKTKTTQLAKKRRK